MAVGSILGMDVGKSMQASSIIVRQGEEIRFFTVGTDLQSSVQIPKGSINYISVGRDFLPPAGAKQGDALVSAKGSINVISVGRNLGKAGRVAFGKIVASSITLIQSSAGNITTNIESTEGDIDKVEANYSTDTRMGGSIYGNITAIDGNLGIISADKLYGNVAAKRDGTSTLTGNIFLISLGEILASKSIKADTTIDEISLANASKVITTTIEAQAGGTLLKTLSTLRPAPLTLKISNGMPFRGTVIFAYGNAPQAARIVFAAPESSLLNYTYNGNVTSWSVNQTAGTDTGVYVQNATFNFKNTDPLKDQKPLFTKINTANTPTTDFTVSQDKKK